MNPLERHDAGRLRVAAKKNCGLAGLAVDFDDQCGSGGREKDRVIKVQTVAAYLGERNRPSFENEGQANSRGVAAAPRAI